MGGHAQILGSVYRNNVKMEFVKDYLLESSVTPTLTVMHSFTAQFKAYGLIQVHARNLRCKIKFAVILKNVLFLTFVGTQHL